MMLLLAAALSANTPANWPVYTNVRYGYSVCHPGRATTLMRESPNGDGATFQGRDGGEVLVYGENDVDGAGLTQHVLAASAEREHAGAHITLQKIGRSSSMLSGYTGEEVFYERTIARGDQFVTISSHYPKSRMATWNPVVTAMVHCLRLGRRAF